MREQLHSQFHVRQVKIISTHSLSITALCLIITTTNFTNQTSPENTHYKRTRLHNHSLTHTHRSLARISSLTRAPLDSNIKSSAFDCCSKYIGQLFAETTFAIDSQEFVSAIFVQRTIPTSKLKTLSQANWLCRSRKTSKIILNFLSFGQ